MYYELMGDYKGISRGARFQKHEWIEIYGITAYDFLKLKQLGLFVDVPEEELEI
jgi:hypothetical protein